MQPCQTSRAAAVAGAGPAAVAAATPWHSLQHRCQSSTACCASPLTTASFSVHVPVSRVSASLSKLQLQQQCRPLQQQQEQQQRRGGLSPVRAGPIDSAPVWTLDQIAGLVFGAVMLAFYFSSNYVDVYIARQQRKQLGLCERCGGLNDAATCSQEGCPMKSKAAQ